MKKKQIFSYSGLVFFLVCLVFISGCGGRSQIKKEKPGNQSSGINKEKGQEEKVELSKLVTEEQKSLARLASQEVKPSKTSIYKINQDWAQKKITEKEAIKLRLQALVNPDELNEKYKGEERKGRSSLNSDTKWILNNWEDFNEEEKAEFRPYILPPDEEGSIFYGEDEDLGGLFIKKARAASPNWENREVNLGASAKLHYKQKGSWSEAQKDEEEDKAIHLEIALEDSWPEFKNLLGMEPSERVYVYLVKMNDCGEAFMQNKDGARRCIINIKTDQSEKVLKASLAHELFHCFQYELASKYWGRSNDIDWICEGTAVWAENYIYPDYNSEHQYLSDYFFGRLDEELVTAKNDWEYGRYMWFYFLSQYYDDSYVAQTLKKAGNTDIREAAQNTVPEYELAYQDFAFYNWNYGPFFKYKDKPKFPEGKHPRGNASKYFTDFEEQDEDYRADLDKGAMDYRMHSFNPDKGAKYAIFEFKEHTEDITITALMNNSGTWQKENWNQVTKKEICLADDQTNMIVLIVANSDLKNKNKLDYNLKLESECPKISRGTMILEQEVASEGGHTKAIMRSEDKLEYDPESKCMKLVERSISCDFDSASSVMQGTPMHLETTARGQGGVSETYENPEDRSARICFYPERTVLVLDPDTKNNSYMTVTHTMTANEPWTEEDSCPVVWPHEYLIDQANVTENEIKGEEQITHQGMFGEGSIKIKYDYYFYKEN